MINPDGIRKDPATGKWRVFFGGEWLYTCDTYEQADDLLRDCYCYHDEDEYDYEEPDYEEEDERDYNEDYYGDPERDMMFYELEDKR